MNIHLTWPDSADVDAGANSVNHVSRWLLLIKTAKVITPDKGPPRERKTTKTMLKERTSFRDGDYEDPKEVISFESVVKTGLLNTPPPALKCE